MRKYYRCYISNFIRPMDANLDKVVAYDMGLMYRYIDRYNVQLILYRSTITNKTTFVNKKRSQQY